ncbi:MAG: NAD(P)-dependent oxidoreductase [Verrucomicrobia bacterium]|nr:NAD(P)-dependent oxidoreductase [Verrucomicrobiota bacterium]
MSQTVAFVGVGKMGANMARRLKECGYNVTAVLDVNTQAAADLATELGCKACTSLTDVTAAADVIFTVVTNDAAMRGIFLGSGDSLLTNASGKIFVNCATLSPAIHREVYAAAAAAGAHSLEACMASSISHAREGKLYLMLAGDEATYQRVQTMIEQMSMNRRFIGGPGSAAEVKALVNMVMNINTAGLAEGLGLAAALGHDLNMIREVFSQTGANSRVLETDSADMVAREHDCWFSAEHAAKDSGIAADVAKSVGLNLPLNDATKAQYEKMVALGLGGLDKSGIAELTFKGRHA